jgi:hypothetical protein
MTIKARCHCGRTVLEVDDELPAELTRCTCSLCSKRGHLFAYFEPDKFTVAQSDSDGIYRWNTKQVANHFCSACGCDTYADSLCAPTSSVNLATSPTRRCLPV